MKLLFIDGDWWNIIILIELILIQILAYIMFPFFFRGTHTQVKSVAILGKPIKIYKQLYNYFHSCEYGFSLHLFFEAPAMCF